MSHTPGPWTVHGGWGGMVKAKDGRFVAECRNRQLKPNEVEANMSLIAAAPDMLYALEQVEDLIECNCGSVCEGTCSYSYVVNAIKKARGQ